MKNYYAITKRAHIATIHFHSLSHALVCFDIHKHWRVTCLLQNTCTYNGLQMPSWRCGKILPETTDVCMTAVFLQATSLCSWPVSREVPYTKIPRHRALPIHKDIYLRNKSNPGDSNQNFWMSYHSITLLSE